MSDDQLELTSLQDAMSSLARSIEVVREYEYLEEKVQEVLRSGVIQNFEIAYEFSWKHIKRWLELNLGSGSLTPFSIKLLIRRAAECELITDSDLWLEFHKARNSTSHIYSKESAKEVFDKALEFLPQGLDLLEKLEERL
ncbi:MAG: nucleotidyltransferase substrate binding protein [Planctomycetaceae bacterium]|jgi:nucleotidyltransferase substrate binding protein (TIGR01987 family)|nr:nucleotidyltransferase substrate binding protein [Planctomycetaceae bacterium]